MGCYRLAYERILSTHFSGQSARNAFEEPEAEVLHLHPGGAFLSAGNHIRRGNVVGSAGSQRTSSGAIDAESDDHDLAGQGEKIIAVMGVLQKAQSVFDFWMRPTTLRM